MQESKHNNSGSLKNRAISSTGWGFLDQVLGFGIQFVIIIVLARLLSPSDFGLVGLGMIVIGFGRIFVNLGLGPSLIHKKDLTERHIRVAFTISVIAGLFLALIVYFSAPLIAVLLDNQDVIPIVEALSIIFIIAALQISSRALLKKELNFKHLFVANFSKNIFYGIITIALAWYGFGVWSLVIGDIISMVICFLVSYSFARHSLVPLLARDEFNDLARFGSGMTLGGIFNYFALQGDYFIIGRIMGPNALGLYTMAYNLSMKPTLRFVDVLSEILFPTASKIQNDHTKLKSLFLRMMGNITFLVAPVAFFLVIVAPDLVIGLYGEDWAGAIVPLQILGCFGILRVLYNAAAAFLKAKGKVYKILLTQVVYAIFLLVGVVIGIEYGGLVGASLAVSLAIAIMWGLMIELNCRIIEISRREVMRTLVPGLFIALTVAVPTLILKYLLVGFTEIYILRVIVLVITFIVCFCCSFVALPQHLLNYIPYEILKALKNYVPQNLMSHYKRIINMVKRTTE